MHSVRLLIEYCFECDRVTEFGKIHVFSPFKLTHDDVSIIYEYIFVIVSLYIIILIKCIGIK